METIGTIGITIDNYTLACKSELNPQHPSMLNPFRQLYMILYLYYGVIWVLVGGNYRNYHYKETTLFAMDPCCSGNVN